MPKLQLDDKIGTIIINTTRSFHGRQSVEAFDTVPHGASVDVVVTHAYPSSGAVAYRVDLRGVPCANHSSYYVLYTRYEAKANNFVGGPMIQL